VANSTDTDNATTSINNSVAISEKVTDMSNDGTEIIVLNASQSPVNVDDIRDVVTDDSCDRVSAVCNDSAVLGGMFVHIFIVSLIKNDLSRQFE